MAKGISFEDSFQNRTGLDILSFQNNWEIWAKNKELKFIPGITALTKEFKNQKKSEENFKGLGTQRSKDLTFLGDILKSLLADC